MMETAIAAGRGLVAAPRSALSSPSSEFSSSLARSSVRYSSRSSRNFSAAEGRFIFRGEQRALERDGFCGGSGSVFALRRRNFGQTASCKLGSVSLERGVGGRGRSSAGERAGFGSLAKRRVANFVTRSSSEKSADVKVDEAVHGAQEKADESKAATGEAVEGVKDESAKLKDAGAEKYEATAEKSDEVMVDVTDKLRAEAEKARAKLAAASEEAAALGKSGLSHLAENAPDPIKGIAQTAADAHVKEKKKQGARIHDFCLGIPYGALLVAGGLLSFIITGNTAAIRFGVVLGGLVLFLSIRSLNGWKAGKSSMKLIQGQATIAFLFFFKDTRNFFATGALYPWALLAFASGSMLAFYLYVYFSGGNPPKKVAEAVPTPAT